MSAQVSDIAWSHLASSEAAINPCGHLTHAALLYLLSQVESGVCCPLSMTYAATPVLAQAPHLKEVLKKTPPNMIHGSYHSMKSKV